MSNRKKKKEKDRYLRSHGALEGIAEAKCCKGEKVRPTRVHALPGLAEISAQSQSARLLVEATSQHQCARI